jgi:hypothetical protein
MYLNLHLRRKKEPMKSYRSPVELSLRGSIHTVLVKLKQQDKHCPENEV